jgi:hypothetical protein
MFGEPHRRRAYLACPMRRGRHGCEQKAVRSSTLQRQVGTWLRTLRIPDDWRANIEWMQRGSVTATRRLPRSM